MSRQKTNPKTLQTIVIIGGIILLAFLARWNSQRAVDNRKNNKCYAIGRITRYVFIPKGRQGFEFEFFVDGSKYESYHFFPRDVGSFTNKKFPVVYECDNPSNSNMLIFPGDFRQNNEVFPDSLSWVRQYVE